jgi:hypothetical protein
MVVNAPNKNTKLRSHGAYIHEQNLLSNTYTFIINSILIMCLWFIFHSSLVELVIN